MLHNVYVFLDFENLSALNDLKLIKFILLHVFSYRAYYLCVKQNKDRYYRKLQFMLHYYNNSTVTLFWHAFVYYSVLHTRQRTETKHFLRSYLQESVIILNITLTLIILIIKASKQGNRIANT